MGQWSGAVEWGSGVRQWSEAGMEGAPIKGKNIGPSLGQFLDQKGGSVSKKPIREMGSAFIEVRIRT